MPLKKRTENDWISTKLPIHLAEETPCPNDADLLLSKVCSQFKLPSFFFFADAARVRVLRDPVHAAVPLRVVVAALLHRPHDHHGLPLRPHGAQGQAFKQSDSSALRPGLG